MFYGWQMEFFETARDRVVPIALLNWRDVEEAERELKTCLKAGFKGLFVPPEVVDWEVWSEFWPLAMASTEIAALKPPIPPAMLATVEEVAWFSKPLAATLRAAVTCAPSPMEAEAVLVMTPTSMAP